MIVNTNISTSVSIKSHSIFLKIFLIVFIVYFTIEDLYAQTVICTENMNLGTYDCTNIDDVPDSPFNLNEAMASPYNLQIIGAISSTRVVSDDSGQIFYCQSDDRIVTRSITIYNDANFNFSHDAGEGIAVCNFIIETLPDVTPPVFELPYQSVTTSCTLGYIPDLTELIIVEDGDCHLNTSEYLFFSENFFEGPCSGEIIGVRSWYAFDPCGNTSEPQTQTIYVVDTEAPLFTVPPNITIPCGSDPNDISLTGSVTDAMDECDPSDIIAKGIIVETLTQENTPCPGSTTYIKRWGAVDDCVNANTKDQIIIVECNPDCSTDYVSNCQPNWIITEDSPFYNIYQSNNTISTDGFVLIDEDQQVEYKSNRVTLNLGFKVKAGANFRAASGSCN